METLLPLSLEIREAWILAIFNEAKEKVKNPFTFSRAIEHEIYSKRCERIPIFHGVDVLRYGDVDVIDIDSQSTHNSSASNCYTKQLRRIIWALSGSRTFTSDDPKDWIDASDDMLVEGTEHSEWEKAFFAQQDLSRKVLAGKSESIKGIFACTRCKSFDVDTEQKQTRSADEPMTIFCTCNVCGKRFIR
jgi:DNA-directed RNA polymerase subunit M/transcription elongation factor TFIIS